MSHKKTLINYVTDVLFVTRLGYRSVTEGGGGWVKNCPNLCDVMSGMIVVIFRLFRVSCCMQKQHVFIVGYFNHQKNLSFKWEIIIWPIQHDWMNMTQKFEHDRKDHTDKHLLLEHDQKCMTTTNINGWIWPKFNLVIFNRSSSSSSYI